jgi:hypothetical protein
MVEDVLGRPLCDGDVVCYTISSHAGVSLGVVTRATAERVKVMPINRGLYPHHNWSWTKPKPFRPSPPYLLVDDDVLTKRIYEEVYNIRKTLRDGK